MKTMLDVMLNNKSANTYIYDVFVTKYDEKKLISQFLGGRFYLNKKFHQFQYIDETLQERKAEIEKMVFKRNLNDQKFFD